MEFTFQTTYNNAALTAMARALRKTARRKKSRRTHVFGWIIVALAILLLLPQDGETFTLTPNTIITILAALAIVIAFLFEDQINGLIAKKRMLPGLVSSEVLFTEEGYRSKTEIGTSEFKYDNITMIAETKKYFILMFSRNHAQVYDKESITGGTCSDFRGFIARVTGKAIQHI